MNVNHKPRTKRYTTRQAVLRAIDTEQDSLALAISLVATYEAECEQIKHWFALNPWVNGLSEQQRDIWHGKFGRLKLVKNEQGIRQRSIPRHHLKLSRLKAALAEFDTVPMSFLTDGSVVSR